MRTLRIVWVAGMVCCAGLSASAGETELLQVHEWGTFTSFQDEQGAAFARINTDDEPVPSFVHQLFYSGRFSPTELPRFTAKGVPNADPAVTMRLETPVTYFHLPRSHQEMTLDLSVEFRGGWLTEYFPRAESQINGREVTTYAKEKLGRSSIGSLTWRGIHLHRGGLGPETDDRVWNAPRDVDAAQVTVGKETERFLFYRGVGQLDAPLRVVRSSGGDVLQLRNARSGTDTAHVAEMTLSNVWLVQITRDLQTAYRQLPTVHVGGQSAESLAETAATFSDADFSPDNMSRLRDDMHAALVSDGLFDDEASALLNTWELSYFRSPGLRLFFLVPQVWTDRVLPIKLSVPAEITRVMMGRIELVTPRQRQLLREIAEHPSEDIREVSLAMRNLQRAASVTSREQYNALASGRGNPANLGVSVPESYQAFLDLGRFRTALVLDEVKRSRGVGLFIGRVDTARPIPQTPSVAPR